MSIYIFYATFLPFKGFVCVRGSGGVFVFFKMTVSAALNLFPHTIYWYHPCNTRVGLTLISETSAI